MLMPFTTCYFSVYTSNLTVNSRLVVSLHGSSVGFLNVFPDRGPVTCLMIIRNTCKSNTMKSWSY